MVKFYPHELEPNREEECVREVASPMSIGRFSSNGNTLPSSRGSCGSITSGNDSILEPTPINVNLDDDQTDNAWDESSGCTWTKIILTATAFSLLFGAGLLGGLLTSGTFSRDAVVSPSNYGNQTANEAFPTASPSATLAMIDNDTTTAPSVVDSRTGAPTETPTELTPDVTAIPNPPPPTSSVFPDGTYNYRANSEYLVGVYYYPWHGENFHNDGGYMRKEIVPRHYPSLGEYDDRDPQVIAEHMKMFRRANIGLLVTSWWGPDRLEDTTTKDVIMNHQDVGNLNVALFYETTNRLRNGIKDILNAKTDIEYISQHYFDHPNYYKINGRPVLFIYLARTLENRGTLEEALLTMRSEAAKKGHNIFLVGDYVFGDSPRTTEEEPYIPFWYFDAVTNYDVYGSSGRPEGYAGRESVSMYYEKQAQWKAETAKEDCRYIPAVSPGYNDRGVRLESDHPAMSRRLTKDGEEGSLFHYQLKYAKELVDPQMDKLIMVNSFNEWHEDTQIEPVAVGDSAVWPPRMTQDLEYVGYGNLYLDILGASTKSEYGQGIFDYLFEY
ncbi:glycosyl hydrolase family 99 protein [Nitzschia inconspicua]|uniref:Glycosyl hydrolase family 99 protein n=1 Tax=Nitzschia inconspicua TaxID=303405 RepID=A0A9K3KXW0_9STRA|nr:glycosyl hydrolase family 99 protein [Nitzschia inconspicua]